MPAVPFRAEVGGTAELAAVELHGDMNVAAAAGFEAAYEAAAALEARVVLLDFTDAGYINSTGIALIVRLLADARRDGREVRACGLTPHYTEIFGITRLSDFMQIFADRDGASAAPVATTPGGVQ
ncbi:MAG: STAS domain-containing protein [Candidatus Limnocylindrales bacterium]